MFKNESHWNVWYWFNNDATLNRMRQDVDQCPSRHKARIMLDRLRESGMFATPDGVRYTLSNVTSGMREI